MSEIGAVALVPLTLLLWLSPGLIATIRGHQQAAPIWVVTVLLSWTGIGWVVALAWSLSAVRRVA